MSELVERTRTLTGLEEGERGRVSAGLISLARPSSLRYRAQLQGSNGQCWSARYSTAAVNSSTVFQATSD